MKKPDYNILKNLVNVDSPSGYTHHAIDYISELLRSYGFNPRKTPKGALVCPLGSHPKTAITAHTDTLGAMVSGIKNDGTLKFTLLGGLSLSTAEGEYVRIITSNEKIFTGTLLLNNPSAHSNNKREDEKRTIENMHVRIDEEVYSMEDTRKLGIKTGDFICFEPRYTETESGFIKSRFMDNKAGCFVLLEVARLVALAQKPIPVELFFSTFEEVGHGGAAGYSDGVFEILVVDMGVVGDACEGNEVCCSICVKDSSGPYDYLFRKELTGLALEKSIPHKLDVYPYYSSDGTAALRGGNDFRAALIGPGVAASHGMERTHKKGIEATISLCMAYLEGL